MRPNRPQRWFFRHVKNGAMMVDFDRETVCYQGVAYPLDRFESHPDFQGWLGPAVPQSVWNTGEPPIDIDFLFVTESDKIEIARTPSPVLGVEKWISLDELAGMLGDPEEGTQGA